MPCKFLLRFCSAALALLLAGPVFAQRTEVIPHGQDRPPNPPLSPQEAIKKMVVPKGFKVELVAAEPDIVNPVAMTFDERGRIWITESLEYPRHSAGPGKDRVKVLESTKGDGKYDRITTVIEGLNIPSGIAVGWGGVWVANSPDILFYPIENWEKPKVGKPQVVVTGFGRDDTHELPNSLTWGPDGWLYGLNGVFNRSRVKHKGKVFDFTCAMFRIHPRTKDFEIFCEGTSNPWGIAFDPEGSAFVSACVIDHLWHLVQTGSYIRQGGPYPPFTWPMGSIVKHRHQKAAYCGLHYFDSDAYPPEYRGKLYMGNIHGNCINCDELTRDGSTYLAKPRPDFLTANDAWFMPVAQRTGPDGCLYILDWYDRYHCYQDAGRDPKGIDRERGRLYRVVYKDYKAAGNLDLAQERDEQLIRRLASPSIYYRDLAQRLLCERLGTKKATKLAGELERVASYRKAPRKARLHALWAVVGAGSLSRSSHIFLMEDADPTIRAWTVRAATHLAKADPRMAHNTLMIGANDTSPDVQLQLAIAWLKWRGRDSMPALLSILDDCGTDKLIPHIVWQNLHPLLEDGADDFVKLAADYLPKSQNLARLMPRAVDRILASRKNGPAVAVDLLVMLTKDKANADGAMRCMEKVTAKIQTGELGGAQLSSIRNRLLDVSRKLMPQAGPVAQQAAFLAATLKDPEGLRKTRSWFGASEQPGDILDQALNALAFAGDLSILDQVLAGLADPKTGSPAFRGKMLAALERYSDPRVADGLLAIYPKMEAELRPRAIELLTERPNWAKRLIAAIGRKKISHDVLNLNQVRRLLASKDTELVKEVKAHWGTVRDDRNPDRERVVAQMGQLLRQKRGDAQAGWKVFKTVCAQCHKIYGEGVEVGPDITANGRASFEQLLSNVFDPSLVIGSGYQATTVVTTGGQLLTGLVTEDSKQRIVLKTQGGKLETIPRGEIESVLPSKLSMMPEQLEKQVSPQEIVDLFAFLTLDRPPTDPRARLIPGTPEPKR
jgi:putative heme-binding domain-containing protein